jgi:hypothetical protein
MIEEIIGSFGAGRFSAAPYLRIGSSLGAKVLDERRAASLHQATVEAAARG